VSGNDVCVREATIEDLEAVVRLHHHVLETSLPYLPILHTIEEGLVFFAGVFSRCTVLVAREGGTIVGYCAYRDG
jgi:hypothetical protein